MDVFRLVLTATFVVSGGCFVLTALNSHQQGLPVANAIVFGTSMLSLAILEHGSRAPSKP